MTQRRRRRLGAGIAFVVGLWVAAPNPGAAQAPEPVATTGSFTRVAAPGGLQPRTELRWTVEGAGPGSPLSGTAVVGPDGTVALGPYGAFHVVGLTVEQARERVEWQLRTYARGARVRLAAADITTATEWRSAEQAPRPLIPVGGPHLIPSAGSPASAPQLQPVPSPQPPAQPAAQPQPPTAPPSQFAHQFGAPAQPGLSAGLGVRSAWRPILREGTTHVPAPQGGSVHQAGSPPQPMPPGPSMPPAGKPVMAQRTSSNGGPEVAPPPQPAGIASPDGAAFNGGVVGAPPHDAVVMGPHEGPHAHGPHGHGHPGHRAAPNEAGRVILPPYVIGPPDVLQIDSLEKLLTQPVNGPHLVRPDGTVSLGGYGSVLVAGLTVEEARMEVARRIHSRLDPNVRSIKDVLDGLSMDVLAYNSKVYYVITDRLGLGEVVTRLPITGGETVLDAISQIQGLPPESSKRRIWVARKTAGHGGGENKLEVDWYGITRRGEMRTNYQMLPGDRLYVKADAVQRTDYFLAKILSPIQRLLGVTLLGSETVNSIKGQGIQR
jgi:polysaccharide export outer membrane protein